MMAQLIKKAEEEETQKNTELQPMVQVQVPEGAKPGTKLSVQAAKHDIASCRANARQK